MILRVEGFLDAASCAAIIDELRTADHAAAKTYGSSHAVDVRVRKTTRVNPSDATRALIERLLREAMPSIASHFGIAVADLEEPQFLGYHPGDFFVAHQDGNTGMIRFDETNPRRISTVLFLSEPSAYAGGALVFHHSFEDREPVTPPAGTLVAFRAETTHEVTMVREGERYTIVSWYR